MNTGGEGASKARSSNQGTLWVEVVKVAPNLLWFSLAVTVLGLSYGPIMSRLERGDISKLSFAALEIEFVRTEFTKAAVASGTPTTFASPVNFVAFADRIQRSATVLSGAKALWVDDMHPSENFAERRALSALGIGFDLARSNDEAQALFDAADAARSPYDLIISDIGREPRVDPTSARCFPQGAQSDAGCKLVQIVRGRYPINTPPIILYSGDGDANGTPPGAFGATNRFDELAALVLDAVERRGQRERAPPK